MNAPTKATLKSLTTGEVTGWIQDLDDAASDPDVVRLQKSVSALRAAASVLTGFDPATLVPWDPPTTFDEDARLALLKSVATVEGAEAAFACRLELGARRTALEQLKGTNSTDTRKRLRKVLELNARPASDTQKMLEAAIAGKVPPPDSMSREDLLCLATVAEWLHGILDDIPKPAELQRLIARSNLLDPLLRLVGDHFVGRGDELRRLADHVGALDIDRSAGLIGTLGQAARRGRGLLSSVFGQRRPLFVHGAGGIGKSSLLAKFILNHTHGESYEIPFVHLDVDRPNVDPLRPLTFLAVGLEQLAQQLPGVQRPARELANQIQQMLRTRETVALESVEDSSESLVGEFAGVVGRPLGSRPLLFIVDTFEEVQFLGSDAVGLVMRLLMQLQEAMPNLRIVVSGRNAPDNSYFYLLSVSELPREPAIQLLTQGLSQSKYRPTPSQLEEIIETIGGNPMVLNLAARLIAAEDMEGALAGGKSDWLRRVSIEATQARLFGRVLRHIHNRQARKLAVPGLLLRRVNAQVVLEVLAGPCKLEVKDLASAQKLVNALGKELAVVTHDARDGSLVYRADIRRIMLETVGSSVSEEVARDIDERAIEFWKAREDQIARGEELYHRLRRNQTSTELNGRWDPSVGGTLRSALGEIPAEAQRWLANKLGVSITEDSRLKALQPEWEELAARTAQRLLADGQPAEALKVVREREERIGSRISTVEARTLFALGRLEESWEVARKGGVRAANNGDAPGEVELSLLSALSREAGGAFGGAFEDAARAAKIAELAGLSEWHLRSLVQAIRISRRWESALDFIGPAEQQLALTLVDQIGIGRIEQDSALLRDAAAELGHASHDLLVRAFEELGADIIRTASREDQREVLVSFAGLSPSSVDMVIDGNPYELAKLGSQGLLRALFSEGGPVSEATDLVLKLLRDATDRAIVRPSAMKKVELPYVDPDGKRLRLSSAQQQAVVQYVTTRLSRAELQRSLLLFTQRELETYVSPYEPFPVQVYSLVNAAQKEGWVDGLIQALESTESSGKGIFNALADRTLKR